MKSEDQLTDEMKDVLKALLKSQDPTDEVVKAASYQSLSRKLDEAVKAKAKEEDRWGWAYVRDFDDDIVVYSGDGGVFARSYSEGADGNITLGDEVTEVNMMITYEDNSGSLVLTESDSISSKVSGLVLKSFSTDKEDLDKLKDIFKSKNEEVNNMNELQKSLDAATGEIATLKAALEKAEATAASATAALDAINQAQAIAKSNQRKELLKAVTTEDSLEALHKSLEALDDTAFDTVLKTLGSVKETSEQAGGMFTQVSKATAEAPEAEAPGADLIAMLKSKNRQ
jgi:hypothetical protein